MVRFLISTTEEMRDVLRTAANQQGQTLNGLIRQILWDWVKQQETATRDSA